MMFAEEAPNTTVQEEKKRERVVVVAKRKPQKIILVVPQHPLPRHPVMNAKKCKKTPSSLEQLSLLQLLFPSFLLNSI